MDPGTHPRESLLERSFDPAVVTDPDQRIVDANGSAARLFGYADADLIGRSLHDLLPDLKPSEPRALLEAATVTARHRDGSTMELRVTFCPVPVDHQDLIAAYFQPSTSIFAHDSADETTLGRLPIAVLRFDAEARVVYANAKASELTGRPRVDTIGRSPLGFAIATPLARTWAAVVEEVIRTRESRRFEIKVETAGREWWFEATVFPERLADGTTGAIVAAFDITAHHQAAAQLEASEIRFRRLAEGSQDLISQHAVDGTFLYASPAAAALVGREPETLVGIRIGELVEPDDRDRIEDAIRTAVAGERSRPVAFKMFHRDGRIVSCELTAHAADQGERGEPTVICITRDITERVRGEEILRAASRMEATATLAAGVAHDFNNLMTGIMGNAELLLGDPADPDVLARLGQIADAATRGGELAQQLLAYARGGKYQTAAVDVNLAIHQALHLHKHALPPRIHLEEDLDPTLPTVDADVVQIGQVVTNLCINASEAIENLGRLTVRTRRVQLEPPDIEGKPGLEPGTHVLLQVQDTGSGIEPAVLARIFEPFFSTKFQGRGLGLAAAYGIVKNHHGYIGVESTPGAGTTFSIYLPASSAPARPQPPLREVIPTGNETILLVDDDDAVVDVTRALLEKLEYRVLVARHGIEAVNIARAYEGAIHLTLLDMGMPIAGGAEAFPLLRKERPDMRILLSSGYEINEVVQDLLNAGADAFLQKPYRISALARGIRYVLEGKARGERLDD